MSNDPESLLIANTIPKSYKIEETLRESIINGDIKLLKQNIKSTNQINYHFQYGNTLLHIACQNWKNFESIKLLIENGADTNARSDIGETPLHTAICYQTHNALELLIKNGSDPNAKSNDGTTPLHYAAQEGYMDVCELLVKYGAQIDPVDSTDWTPLHAAFYRKHLSCVAYLIQHGSEPNYVRTRPLLLVRPSDRDKNLVRNIVIWNFHSCNEFPKMDTSIPRYIYYMIENGMI